MGGAYSTNSEQYNLINKLKNDIDMINETVTLNFENNELESIEWLDTEYNTMITVTSTNEKSLLELEKEITPILEDSFVRRMLNNSLTP